MKMLGFKTLIAGYFLMFLLTPLLSQIPKFSPTYHTNSEGKLYWNKELPVYLRIAATPEDKGVLLNSEQHDEYVNPLYLDTEGVNYIRTRYAVDPQTQKTVVPNTELLMEVYADGTSPATSENFKEAQNYTSEGTHYYGKNLHVALASADKHAGVDKILFSLDGQIYKPYQNEIRFDEEGRQKLHFFSVDHVGNAEEEKVREFIVDISSPSTYHNVNGIAEGYIIALSSTIYLTFEDNLSGVKETYYRFDEEDYRLYNGEKLKMAHLIDGEHVLNYFSIDQVGNKEEDKKFEFYFDKTAPITVADVLGDRYIVDDKIYLSGRTKMKLTAVDNKAGVKEIRYSIDGKEFEIYDEPFYLPSVSGNHLIRYYSLDNLSNQTTGKGGSGFEEYKHNVSKVYLDLTGPTIDYDYIGNKFSTRDTMFINSSTKINLTAADAESGMQYISYSLDGVSEESRYEGPFAIDQSGFHGIEIFSYDNVNNRNVKTFFCVVDGEAPDVIVNFSIEPIDKKEGLDVFPSYVQLYLAAKDKTTGADKIFYKVNNGTEKTYLGIVDGWKPNTKYTMIIRATDLVGNDDSKTIEFYTGD